MKKIILMIVLLMALVGCTSEEVVQNNDVPVEKGEHFEVYDITKYNRPVYQYFIFSRNHLVFTDGIVYGFPQITESGQIVKLCVKVYEGVFNCRYIDIITKHQSVWFISPVAENDTLVAYPDQPWGATKIIVQNIFDKSEYYREFERSFDSRENPVDSAEFINDGKQLCITYITKKGDYYEIVTETLDLD